MKFEIENIHVMLLVGFMEIYAINEVLPVVPTPGIQFG